MTPFIGQITIFGFDWAPQGWARCDGQLLAIAQNDALFSLLGTIYGGDGRTTFGLPALRGRASIHSGTGAGMTNRKIGAKAGTETTTLNINNLPSHAHGATVAGSVNQLVGSAAGNSDSPSGTYLTTTGSNFYVNAPSAGEFAGALQNDLSVTISNTGGTTPISNMQPYLVVNYCIALVGLYPSRN